jgi:Secretion system C-terminal sorting domain
VYTLLFIFKMLYILHQKNYTMQKIIFFLLALGGTQQLQAQNNPCTQPGEYLICTTLIGYDDAGNRTERKEVCYCGIPDLRTAGTGGVLARTIKSPAAAAASSPDALGAISKIFPNPTNSTITVLFSESISKGLLSISDGTGKQIETVQINSAEVKIDISQYPAGMYFLSLRTDGKIDTQRVVKTD